MKYLTEKERQAILELKDILSKKYRLIEIKLFGSKARGTSDQESDTDLFILVEECDWGTELEIYDLCFEIGLRYDVLLSPIIYSRERAEDKLTQVTPFYKMIKKEGIPL